MDGTVLKAFVTLVGCIAFLGAVLWWVKRKTSRGQAGSQDIRIRIVARQPLGSKASVAVVEVGDKTLILGITEHAVTNLGSESDSRSDVAGAPGMVGRRATPSAPPTFGPPPTYPPTVPPAPFSAPTGLPAVTGGTQVPDLSIGGYLRTLFRRG